MATVGGYLERETVAFVPTEDAVQALIDHLVYPLLPRKDSSKEPPPITQQEVVAKQVHAVVLLYNYYHRKQFPQLEFLNFESFCKAATIAKPSLLMFMKYMRGYEREAAVLDENLSVTEKAIVNACNICIELDAAKATPVTECLPVSKVAVFLVNLDGNTCVLEFSSMTQGVWSLFEKDIDATVGSLGGSKNKGNSMKINISGNVTLGDGSSANDDVFQKIAFSVVEQKTGIDMTNLTVLGRHLTYSLTEEKRATVLFIMKYKQTGNGEFTEVPIDDVMSSLRGPIVRLGLIPEVSPVVEYYHLLPYEGILSGWLSSGRPPNDCLHSIRQQADADKFCPEQEVKYSAMENMTKDKIIESRPTMVLSNNIMRIGNETKNKKGNTPSDADKFCPEQEVKYSAMENMTKDKIIESRPTMVLSNNIMKIGNETKNKKGNTPSSVNGSSGAAFRSQKASTGSSIRYDTPSELHGLPLAVGTIPCKVEKTTRNQSMNNRGIESTSLNEPSESFSKPQTKVDDSLKYVRQPPLNASEGRKAQNKEQSISNLCTEGNMGKPSSQAASALALNGSRAKAYGVDPVKRTYAITNRDGEGILQKAGEAGLSVQDGMATHDLPLVPVECNSNNGNLFQHTMSSRRNDQLQTSLQVLKKKREELGNQHRMLEDDIAQCEMSIHKILNGNEEDLEPYIDSTTDACGVLCSSQMIKSSSTCSGVPSLPQLIKRRRLSEAVLFLGNPCQDLDDICNENNWILPRYTFLPSFLYGKFQANVAVQGPDFECTGGGDPKDNPREARESAANQMLNKLRTMAGQAQ